MKAIKNFIANFIDRKGLDLLFFKHLYIPDFQDVECVNCCAPIGAYDTKLESQPMALCSMCRKHTTIEEVLLAIDEGGGYTPQSFTVTVTEEPEPDMERLPGYGERSSAGMRAYEFIQDLEEQASRKYEEKE